MTPEEKALELLDKFKNDNYDWIAQGSNVTAKKYAIIAVNEIIDILSMPNIPKYYPSVTNEYWQQVKTEINKI